MHPILADWRRLGAYLAGWTLVGTLIAVQLVLAAPFGWIESLVFAIPLALVLGFMGLGAFWVCRVAPLALPRLVRSLARSCWPRCSRPRCGSPSAGRGPFSSIASTSSPACPRGCPRSRRRSSASRPRSSC